MYVALVVAALLAVVLFVRPHSHSASGFKPECSSGPSGPLKPACSSAPSSPLETQRRTKLSGPFEPKCSSGPSGPLDADCNSGPSGPLGAKRLTATLYGPLES